MDPNTGTNLQESKDIIEYLYKNYATFTPPNKALAFASKEIVSIVKPLFAILAPLQAGSYKEDKAEYQTNLNAAISEIGSEINSEKVVVYTYQLSPFCTECLEALDNLDIEYKEISLGLEWVPFLIEEGGALKRAGLGELTGQTSLPHVFVNGESVGGLYDGLVPALEDGTFWDRHKKDATKTDNDVKVIEKVEETGQFE
jgi:glutaredoxin